MQRASLALVLVASIPLAFAATHCGRDEQNIPIDSQFGGGASSGTGTGDAGTGTSGNNSSGNNASGGGGGEYPNDDPNFDPTADGGYWAGRYDAGDAAYLEDGGKNGGPEVYGDYGQCPEVKPGPFTLDGKTDEAAVYGADFSPRLEGTVSRIDLTVASSVPFSFLGPFFPLGFIDPPLTPGLPKVETFPYPGCKRCVFVGTGEAETQFIAIGGMLVIAPSPDPKSGRINARMDLAVLIEAQLNHTFNKYVPKLPLKCIRVRSTPIIVR